MPKGLEPAQNDAIRTFIKNRVMPKYGGQGGVAQAIGQSKSSFSDFMRGARGGSMNLVSILSGLTGVSIFEIMGATPHVVVVFRLTEAENFESCVRLATVQFPDVHYSTWEAMRGLTFPKGIVKQPMSPTDLGRVAVGLQRILIQQED